MRISILGTGNIGGAIADGILHALGDSVQLTLTRREPEVLAPFAARGARVTADNRQAVRDADLVLLCVQPGQVHELIDGIRPELEAHRPILASVATNVTLDELAGWTAVPGLPLLRVMPNTAIAVRESMTCISARDADADQVRSVVELFETVGRVLVVRDDLMNAATVLCACGIAFAMRFVRAASQGGIEIGFHAEEAMAVAAQTILGAARLVTHGGAHPESAIDRVTTPQGCTIAGLNEMEHAGFSSAAIKGIRRSYERAARIEH